MKKYTAWIPDIWEWIAGGGISLGGAAIMREIIHETIHGIGVLIFSVAGAIVIHFTRRFLTKNWPIKK